MIIYLKNDCDLNFKKYKIQICCEKNNRFIFLQKRNSLCEKTNFALQQTMRIFEQKKA
jgi:hypothetical protein